MDWIHYVNLRQTYLAKKRKFVTIVVTDIRTSKQTKMSRKGSKADEAKKKQEEEEAPVPLTTHANNNLHSTFSNVEVYTNNQQLFNSNGLFAHKFYISNNFRGVISELKGFFSFEGYDYEDRPDKNMEAPLSELLFTWRQKLLIGPHGLMLYGKQGVDCSSTSELLYPNMKIGLRLIRARPNFHMISDNPKVGLGIVDCSLYTRRIDLKDDYQKKKMDVLAYTPGVQLWRNSSKEKAKADTETEQGEQEAPISFVTHVNNIKHSIFSNVEVYINNQQIYNSNGLYAHKS